MERFTVEQIWEIFPNKYEAIVVAAKEARRLARIARERKIKYSEKPTILALEKLLKGEIKYKKLPTAPGK
ncbi:MAG: DNA-directed RNA polymerase subunit omega [Candidatus Hydrothermae bacterium]|nr:DNA-directed RNA polymerase subunit omega [Candidatus Hydrothermae bacterium]RKY94182.1 MAG: DNA-directed RNA polymerase subunit omega [Candidatus Hydrothermae bacterium]RKZ03191.1 MAG: DNA-directed RNA polymerase subunit omega [Candidatus Hydrothermae bacterium]